MSLCRVVLGLGLLIAIGCGRSAQPAAAPQRPPTVTVSDVVVQDVPYYVDQIGRCAASDSVALTPQVAGLIESAHFKEGQDVKKGDLLFTIDPRPFQAVVEQQQAALNQSQENRKLAQSEFARVEALKGTSAVSQTEYDQKKSAVAVAEAQVQAAQANLDTAKLNLEYCTIASPINGRTGMRMVDPGNVVKANETALVMVQSFDPIYVDFTIPEDRLEEVRANMAKGPLKAQVEAPNEPLASSASTQPTTRPMHYGTLSMIDNSVQANTGTVRLRATVPNADRYFWPGQFVHVRLILHEDKNALLVPNQAIQVGQKGPYVYVIKHDDEKKVDIAEMRQINPGQLHGDLIVIQKGLSAGEKVITTGQLLVVPNAPVSIAPAQGGPQVAEAKS
jgi:membrane fusion protein, multidrug efflux system